MTIIRSSPPVCISMVFVILGQSREVSEKEQHRRLRNRRVVPARALRSRPLPLQLGITSASVRFGGAEVVLPTYLLGLRRGQVTTANQPNIPTNASIQAIKRGVGAEAVCRATGLKTKTSELWSSLSLGSS